MKKNKEEKEQKEEITIENHENNVKQSEEITSNNKENDTKIIKILLIIALIVTIAIIYIKFAIPDKQIKENKVNIDLTCSNEKPTKFSEIECYINFKLDDKHPKITEISAEIDYDKSIFEETTPKSQETIYWQTKRENNNIYQKAKEPQSHSDIIEDFKFKVTTIQINKDTTIYLKNIKITDENNKQYKVVDQLVNLKINETESNYITNYNYEKNKTTNELVFYKLNKNNEYDEVSKYKCENDDCMNIPYGYGVIPDLDNGNSLIYDGTVLLPDGKTNYYKKIILYNFEKGIIKSFENIYYPTGGIESYSNKKIKKNYILTDINKNTAIIDIDGNFIKEFSDKTFKTFCYEGCSLTDYSIKKDIIVTKNKNGYGIDKISENIEIIEHKFEDIKLENYPSINDIKYFKAKENDKWYFYNLETKEKNTEGYERLYLIDENTILVKIENELYIKDFKGNNITDTTIKITNNIVSFLPGYSEGISTYKENNMINISIYDGCTDNNPTQADRILNYQYNIDTKELTKKDLEQ